MRIFTEAEIEGLTLHRLPTDKPSQLSDAFCAGMAWAIKAAKAREIAVDKAIANRIFGKRK